MTYYSRNDGRQPSDLRNVALAVGQLSRADGSARFSFGSTSSLSSVAGPIEVRIRDELPDRATLEVVHRPLEGVGATPSRALQAAISSALTPLLALSQHPRSLVQIIIQSVSSPSTTYHSSASISDSQPLIEGNEWPKPSSASGSTSKPNAPTASSSLSFAERATSLNAAAIALLDAGSVALRAVPVAISLAYVPSDVYLDVGGSNSRVNGGGGAKAESQLVVDPTAEEEARAQSRFVFGWAFGEGISSAGSEPTGEEDKAMDGEGEAGAELIWTESEGSFSRNEFDQALKQSRFSAAVLLSTIRERLGQQLASRQR